MNTQEGSAEAGKKPPFRRRFRRVQKLPSSLQNQDIINAFLQFKDSGETILPSVPDEALKPNQAPKQKWRPVSRKHFHKKRPPHSQHISREGGSGSVQSPRPQKPHTPHHSNTQPSHASHGVFRPRGFVQGEKYQQFVFKSQSKSPKTFPYLTPKQAFDKYLPHPKEHSKIRAAKGTLRIVPLGGCEQVGINCIAFEYNHRVVLVDVGIQFPDEHMFGVQGRIPDIAYLKDKQVEAVFITHGHIDHIGGIPYIMKMLGQRVPVYAPPMAYELIMAKLTDYKMQINMQMYKVGQIIPVGDFFHVEPFTVDHSIPDSCGLRLHSPVGKFIHTGDWKFDNDPQDIHPATDHELLKSYGKQGVRALLSDSTNAHLPGSSMAERTVVEPLEGIFEGAKGRIFTGTFSSIVDRLQIIITVAEKFGRKVVFLGRGMQMYVTIAQKLGYLKSKPGTLIEMSEANNLPDNQVCICCTGAQGERYAALMRITTGESKDAEFRAGDTVILSSSVIPGNERKVQEMMDLLAEQRVAIHHYRQSNIHSGGHAREEDVKQMIDEIQPQIFIPIYGHRFMLHANADIARSKGYSEDRIMIPRNGQIMEFTEHDQRITDYFASHRTITIDGNLIGFTEDHQMMERYQMSKGGIVIINIKGSKTQAQVYLLSHGFLDFSSVPEMRDILIREIKQYYLASQQSNHSRDEMIRSIRKRVQHIIWTQLAKEPIVVITL